MRSRFISLSKMQDQGSTTVSFCPSFNSYSSSNHHLADIAIRVSKEEQQERGNNFPEEENIFTLNGDVERNKDENDDDFEFILVHTNPDGDETIYPIFPVFNRDLLLDNENNTREVDDEVIQLPLKKLFIDDRDSPSSSSSSSSSSEADELEGVSPGTYCVWTPSKSSTSSPSRCKKSNSTGSSSSSSKQQRWRLRDLLHLKRSSSDGKESFLFLNTDHNNKKKLEEKLVSEEGKTAKGKAKKKEKAVSAHEVFYVRNKALKEGDKRRRSYLPYRQGLVGFFANHNVNVNGLGRSFSPF